MESQAQPVEAPPSPPRSLLSRNPARWLAIFGPGAVIASLTIGVGELVFSARGGAIFGYRLLWYFILVLALKWVLVLASARHIVLTGRHPFQRWVHLPGPRGWLPIVFLVLAAPCFPIWVCFHAGTVGTLLAWLTGTEQAFNGGAYHVWGMGVLAGVLALSLAGGYEALERIQLGIVLLMLAAVTAALFFVQPDWWELLKGAVVPHALQYPAWLTPQSHAEVASRPVWVELATYVGVIGGSSYDYLAYVSYVRDKKWGNAAWSAKNGVPTDGPGDSHSNKELRLWLRAPLVDCTMSFAAVLIFTAVFVALGAVVLGAQHKVPAGANLLSFQAEFVTTIHPGLRYLYFCGAFLAVAGTLYGTIEVAPAIMREIFLAVRPESSTTLPRVRCWTVAWVGAGGFMLLLGSFVFYVVSARNPPGLITILTPANLFTGVLGCGIICLLNAWMDQRFLPANWRMPWPMRGLSLVAGMLFLGLGLKGYWDFGGWMAFLILGSTLAAGWLIARFAPSRSRQGPVQVKVQVGG